jgi:hypothetical protein
VADVVALRPAGEAPPPRFDLAAIEAALRALQRALPSLMPRLRDRRDPLIDEVVRNMLAGYAFIDGCVARGHDLFAMGNLKYLLELNYLVLCGRGAADRERLAEHLRATEERFYDQTAGGIRDVVEWHDRHRGAPVWERAAGVHLRVLSEPQLYLEGNHRSGMLIMSYILAREGKPPVVLTPDTALAFFNLSSQIKQTRKGSFAMLLRMPAVRRRLARLLEVNADPAYCTAG